MDVRSTESLKSLTTDGGRIEAAKSAVSWPAIVAGTVAAASVSLILIVLGSGLGLASVSAWPGAGASAATFTVAAAIWLIVVQWLSSGVGGYLTGRLRTKWADTHTHEVFFRDTAHGLVMWALTTVLGVSLLASAASSAIGTGARVAGTVASGAAQSAVGAGATLNPYEVDTLLRSSRPDANPASAETRSEVTRILGEAAVTTAGMPAADRSYLTGLIAARTGIPAEEAQQRVAEAMTAANAAETKARQAADGARRAGAMASIYTALSMLVGAFIASVCAALGGRRRDEHV
jgi:signal transduction histidine kinase